jgi:hypothetical protein
VEDLCTTYRKKYSFVPVQIFARQEHNYLFGVAHRFRIYTRFRIRKLSLRQPASSRSKDIDAGWTPFISVFTRIRQNALVETGKFTEKRLRKLLSIPPTKILKIF